MFDQIWVGVSGYYVLTDTLCYTHKHKANPNPYLDHITRDTKVHVNTLSLFLLLIKILECYMRDGLLI